MNTNELKEALTELAVTKALVGKLTSDLEEAIFARDTYRKGMERAQLALKQLRDAAQRAVDLDLTSAEDLSVEAYDPCVWGDAMDKVRKVIADTKAVIE